MSSAKPKHLVPGTGPLWRTARRLAQAMVFVALLFAPFLGGWQRLDRNDLAAWDGHGWDLPAPLLDRLPAGDAAKAAYDGIVLVGGGSGAEYFGIPAVDPLAGTFALVMDSDPATRTIVAWLVVVVLALVAGRVFCGWLCPFGTLARVVEFLLERLPVQPPRFAIPRRRPLRFVLLIVVVSVGALGLPALLYLSLPHLLVQQAAYGLWLMGGVGAAFGGLVGLVLAGVLFGPTTYCATLCPTGAALSVLGTRRVVRLRLLEPASCGAHCDLCDQACWLSLHPSKGDPGPDCDSCGRCTEVCPHANLGVGMVSPLKSPTALGLCLLAFLAPSRVHAAPEAGTNDPDKPKMVLDAFREVDGVDVAIAIVDMEGITLDADDPTAEHGVEISTYLARGARGDVDRLGREGSRDVYRGPLEVRLMRGKRRLETLIFESPNHPRSTPNRTVYRRRVVIAVQPGDSIEFGPVDGWLSHPVSIEIPEVRAAGPWRALGGGVAAVLVFGGLISLALALRGSESVAATSDAA